MFFARGTFHLDEVCALQWRRCVESGAAAFVAMPGLKWLEVAYEDLVTAPERELGRVLDFLGVQDGAAERQEAVAGVQAGSVGKGREALDCEAVRRLERLVGDALGV